MKAIAPEYAREKYEGRALKNILFTNIGVFRDKVIFSPWEDGKNSFLIHSRQLIEAFRVYFYSIWDKKK